MDILLKVGVAAVAASFVTDTVTSSVGKVIDNSIKSEDTKAMALKYTPKVVNAGLTVGAFYLLTKVWK